MINDDTNTDNAPIMPEHHGSSGSIIAAIVILAVIIVGALYFWGQRGVNDMGTNETVEEINTQSDSDAAAAIEADLDATDLDSLDAELNESDFSAS